jgi:hypothetical protein
LRFSSSHGRHESAREEERPSCQELRVVEECDARVRRAVLGLSCLPAERALEKDAREVMRDLRPHLEEALAALGRIEGRDVGPRRTGARPAAGLQDAPGGGQRAALGPVRPARLGLAYPVGSVAKISASPSRSPHPVLLNARGASRLLERQPRLDLAVNSSGVPPDHCGFLPLLRYSSLAPPAPPPTTPRCRPRSATPSSLTPSSWRANPRARASAPASSVTACSVAAASLPYLPNTLRQPGRG